MEGLFTMILERGMTASLLVLVVILLRLVFKKMPKWIRCVLWGLVAFRLVCPVFFESSFSLVPDVSKLSEALETSSQPVEELPLAQQENNDTQDVPFSGSENAGNVPRVDSESTGNAAVDATNGLTGNTSSNAAQNTAEPTVTEQASPEQKVTWQQIQQNPMPYIWLGGLLLMALYGVISYRKVKHQVKASWNVKENIFYCDDIETPFVFGLFRPGIYLPSGLDESVAEHVIRHEKEHLRLGDQWWKLLGFGLLAAYWFHPALWVAYILFCRDIEFACDERVIKELEEAKRREYARALLNCSIGKRVILFCPTAFGENGVKSRIRSVMAYKKATIPVLIAAVLVCVVAGALFLTNRKDAYGIERENLMLETDILDAELAERIAEDIAELMVKSREGIYALGNFSFTFYELESEQESQVLRVSVEADSTCLRESADSPFIRGMQKAQSELTYEAERNFAQTMIDDFLAELEYAKEERICEPVIIVTLDEKKYELWYGSAWKMPLADYFSKENVELEQFLGYLTVYQRAGIQPPVDAAGSSGYVYCTALDNPENKCYNLMSCYAFLPTIYYKEGVYSYLKMYQSEEKSELPWGLLGEELGVAYSNHSLYWSERDALVQCTGNGMLYTLKGYEDSYRVVLCYEQTWPMSTALSTDLGEDNYQAVIGTAESAEDIENTTYYMIFCERMNDLWFHEGREVFRDRMHLENAVSVNGLSMEEELLWKLLAELFDATFIHPASGRLPELAKAEHQTLIFQDALGLEHSILLYEGGYAQITANETKLLVKIDEELCSQVMERIFK